MNLTEINCENISKETIGFIKISISAHSKERLSALRRMGYNIISCLLRESTADTKGYLTCSYVCKSKQPDYFGDISPTKNNI